MKFSILIASSVFLMQHISAQSVNFGFNSTGSGRNLTVQYELVRNSHEFSFGLGYNINKLAHNDDQNNIYKKRLYATEPLHHLNINLTYQRYVLTKKVKNIKPFIFYDLQAKYSTTRNRALLPYDYDPSIVINNPEEGILYREYISFYGPFIWLENNIGIGFRADVNDRLYIKQRFGVGLNFILGENDLTVSGFDWEYSSLLHFSIGYTLK